jgi:hypothetical protein
VGEFICVSYQQVADDHVFPPIPGCAILALLSSGEEPRASARGFF